MTSFITIFLIENYWQWIVNETEAVMIYLMDVESSEMLVENTAKLNEMWQRVRWEVR